MSPTEALPDWATETPNGPNEPYYSIYMTDDYGGSHQEIDLSRTEYVALKQRLAELRGLPFDAERAA